MLQAKILEHADDKYHWFVDKINCPYCNRLIIEIIKTNKQNNTREFIRKTKKDADQYLQTKDFKLFAFPKKTVNDTKLKIIISEASIKMAHNTPK